MIHLILKNLPISLAAALSPTLFAGALVILGGRRNAVRGGLAFFAGAGLTLVAVAAIGRLVHVSIGAGSKISHRAALVDVIFGVILLSLFILFAIRNPKPKEDNALLSPERGEMPLCKPKVDFLLGIALTGTDPKILALWLLATRIASGSAISEYARVLAFVVCGAIVLLPIEVPLALHILAPRTASSTLPKIYVFTKRYGHYIVALICLIFGLHMLLKGIAHL